VTSGSGEIELALAGDTMLGRGVAEELRSGPGKPLFAREVAEIAREADLLVLNLECCVSDRGQRWPDPAKPFFFRAPPSACEVLAELGVDCVTLANNHALDFGPEALLDTLDHLDSAGIAWVGAGRDEREARAPRTLEGGGFRLAVVGASDHPSEFAAGPERPGIAFCELSRGELPDWLDSAVRGSTADAVLVTPHWGPNMTSEPVAHVRATAAALVDAGATLVAGHSAHVFHGVSGQVLYDLGDFIDDYRIDPILRNDLGLLFLVTLDRRGPRRLAAVPLKLDYCHTCLAEGEDAAWIGKRFREACAALGREVHQEGDRLVVPLGD
jgi:poly-gamma-glutamate synthesis protein (capsule biosynthesis protein)